METTRSVVELAKRVNIPLTPTSPPGLVEADTVDPWSQAGKYALGWTYFCIILVFLVSITRVYHWWTDKMRQALYKTEWEANAYAYSPEYEYGVAMQTGRTADELFPREPKSTEREKFQSAYSSIEPINDTLALFRWVFYRPIPELRWRKHVLSFPSLAVTSLIIIALAFVTLYCFLPQPLYWSSIQYGSPPLAIRAGMISVAMTPWIIATSMKANLISMMTGIGHDRLNVLHRWGSYLCLFLALVHTIPFYIQPVWEDGALPIFQNLFPLSGGKGYVYGTGVACLVPLGWLCVTSLPIIRSAAYELFLWLHIPVAIVYVGMLFWHSKNYLSSWQYLYATIVIWALCYVLRIFNLNWSKPWRMAWMIGDEAAVTLMAENAIKVTIPTQMRWRPGQFVYLRMPGIALLESHPFTISSLCSEDFPSEYGEDYRDCTVVFRPFGGFTRRVLDTAVEKGPFKTYRAYLEGPYGGMQRELAAFETVVLLAGGSGITAIVSQLLNLIKRMRDGKAVTRKVEVIWAMKRLEAMDWFREELRICREYAPPDSVTCRFFVTSSVRQSRTETNDRASRPHSTVLNDKLDSFVAGIASKRTSALIRDVAQGDFEREQELRAEAEDAITALPRPQYLQPTLYPPPPPEKDFSEHETAIARDESLRRLEGHPAPENDDHAETRRYLAPPGSTSKQMKREFHFPAPLPRHDAPHFQFAPPSPRKDITPSNLPPPPPGPPPATTSQQFFPPPAPAPTHNRASQSADLHLTIPPSAVTTTAAPPSDAAGFDFGFPSTPTPFQKSLMRFAFAQPITKREGWSTEYGRPDLSYILKEMATGGDDGKGILGRRTCVFVCGPPSMRVNVANTVAALQADIWGDDSKDEIFLHTENYAI